MGGREDHHAKMSNWFAASEISDGSGNVRGKILARTTQSPSISKNMSCIILKEKNIKYDLLQNVRNL